ncbi:hypothetical protein LCGC14_2820170 [marine sediment metagenome]|uniref:Uncharacterized protein n=1 Tax=marine sediment metagenome TaxID=412755 RepID=A0A0F8YH83_9ZZZZ
MPANNEPGQVCVFLKCPDGHVRQMLAGVVDGVVYLLPEQVQCYKLLQTRVFFDGRRWTTNMHCNKPMTVEKIENGLPEWAHRRDLG